MPRSGWFALGALGVALAWPAVGVATLPLAAGLGILGGAVAGARSERTSQDGAMGPGTGPSRTGAQVAALLAGALAVGARLWLGAALASPAVADVPAGEGPWAAEVVAVGSPGDGVQRVTMRFTAPAGLLVAATVPRYPVLGPGDRVRVEGRLRAPPADGYGAYLARVGVTATLFAASLAVDPPPPGAAAVLETLRGGSDAALAAALPEPEAGLASGILLGLRSRVDRALAADFTAAGVSHVVAISGWNIAIVAAMVAALLRRAGRRRRNLATLAAIVAYTVFVGASPSVVRAAFMAGVVLLARESGRRAGATAALGWAAALMLLLDPGVAGDAGFQLSSAATGGLIAWGTPLTRRLSGLRLPAWLAETLGVSLAAQAATLPIILLDFGRVSLVSPLANLVVVPLVPAVMAGGALALVAGWLASLGVLPAAALAVAAFPGWLLLAVLVGLVRLAAAAPFASLTLEPPLAAGLAALAAVGLALLTSPGRRLARAWLGPSPLPRWRRRPRSPARPLVNPNHGPAQPAPDRATRWGRRLLPVALVAAMAVVLVAASRPDGRLHLVVLDVGQGDAILLEGGRGTRLLVDGGPDPEHLLAALDARLPAWDRRLDMVVLTHPHEDHAGGLAALLERYRVGRVFEPGMAGAGPAYRAWQATLASQGRTAAHLAAGDSLELDGLRLDVLWPRPGSVPARAPDEGRAVNDVSIVLLGAVGSQRFLLTGDAEDDIDPELLAAGLPHLALLKVAHHGSATSSSNALLEATRPELAVVSVGTGNRYGHPAPATLDRLAATAAAVLRTDRDGTVEAVLDGERMAVRAGGARRTALGGAAFQDRPRSAPADPFGRGFPVVPLLYHRVDEHPGARRGRRPPPLPRPAGLASAPLARRRRGRRLARRALRGAPPAARPPPRGGGRAPARRRQAAAGDGPA